MSQLTCAIESMLQKVNTEFVNAGGMWYTTTKVEQDIRRVRSLLADTKLQPGERVLIGYPNSYAFVVAYLSVLEYGAVAVPVNPNMPPAELHVFLVRSQVSFSFLTKKQWTQLKGKLNASKGHDEIKLATVFLSSNENTLPDSVCLKTDGEWLTSSAENQLQSNSPVAELPEPDSPPEDAIGVLLYTSGTTGKPKAVGLKHRHLYAAAQNVVRAHALSSDDVAYCVLPLFHINAEVVVLLSTCVSQGRMVIAPKFSATEFWPTVLKYQVTWVSAVPTILAILMNIPGPAVLPPHLRFVRSASARLPIADAEAFEQRFQIPIIQSYGMTEAASQICVNPLEADRRKLTSVGLPAGVQLRVEDEKGKILQPGEIGEIVIRGENVIEKYEEAPNQNDFENGWFHTGDLGYADEEGYVFLTGRKKEIINRAGEKISPYEVEDVIRQHPNVEQVAVIGLPDELYGERVAAYITLNSGDVSRGTVIEETAALCKRVMSRYKCPSEIHVVSEIPVGATGKIQRNRLKDEVLSAASSPV